MRKLDLKPNGIYVMIDLVFFVVSVYAPYIFYYNKLDFLSALQVPFALSRLNLPSLPAYSLIFLCWGIITVLVLNNCHLYSTARDYSIPKEVVLVFKAVILSCLPIVLGIFILKIEIFSRFLLAVSVFLIFLFFSIWRIIKRLILRRMIRRGFNNINVLIVGAGHISKAIINEISLNPLLGMKICGLIDDSRDPDESVDGYKILGKTEDFEKIVRKKFVDEVFIAIPSHHAVVRDILDRGAKLGVNIKIIPESYELISGNIRLQYLGVIPLFAYYSRGIKGAVVLYKRLFDVFVSSVLLLLLSPAFIIIAIMIKIDAKGPCIYIQKRVGLKGRHFNLYKFRSMIKNADDLKPGLLDRNEVTDGIIFKIKKDPRITRIGRFLRKYSLDELPQFFNVLKGDMSLVGPRPPTLNEVTEYKNQYLERLSVKPGITGLAQIKGRSDLTFHKWMRWDSWYVNNWSFMLDLKILLQTIPVVIRSKGAY